MNKKWALNIILAVVVILGYQFNIVFERDYNHQDGFSTALISKNGAETAADDMAAFASGSDLRIDLARVDNSSVSSSTSFLPEQGKELSEDGNQNTGGQVDLISSKVHSSASIPSSPLLKSAVNILNGRGRHVAIGTKINADTILTHNHQKYSLDLYTAVDPSKTMLSWSGQKTDPVGRQVEINGEKLGQQTRLVTFDRPLAGETARIASQRTIRSLKSGDQVDIVYWNDESGQLAVGQFTISNIDNLRGGIISVADPEGILNIGDSGGGVFFHNELIGNTWSIVGGGHIALVPARVDGNDRAVSFIEPITQ